MGHLPKFVAPWGMSYPPNFHDLVDMRGGSKDGGMCRGNATFITTLTYMVSFTNLRLSLIFLHLPHDLSLVLVLLGYVYWTIIL